MSWRVIPHTGRLSSRTLPAPDLLAGLADPADLPILVTALREGCPWLVTFNVRRHQPGHSGVVVLRPGDFLLRVRDRLARLAGQGQP